MARRGRRGRRGGFKIPIISTAILGAQLFWAHSASGGNPLGTLNNFQSLYTGFDVVGGQAVPVHLLIGYGPWLAKRFIMPIARPRMPVRGLPISIS